MKSLIAGHISANMRKFFVAYSWQSEKQSGTGMVEMKFRGTLSYSTIKGWKDWIDDNTKDSYGEPISCTITFYGELDD